MLKYDQIKQKQSSADSKKGNVNHTYKEVFRFAMPDRDYYSQDTNGTIEGQQTHNGIYSSVAINASDEFVNKIQSSLTPIKADFFELITDNDKQQKDVAEISKTINFYKNKSNFDLEVSSFYYDLVAGTACLLCQRNTLEDPLVFTAVPIKDISYLQGANSMITSVFRCFDMTYQDIKYQWDELNDMELDEKEQDKSVKLIECTYYDYEEQIWYYYIVNEDKKEIIVEREYNYNPLIILRWSPIAGEIWGRGVGLKALPDIKSHNDLSRDQLKVAHFSLPIFLAEEDSMTDPDEFILEPLAMNPVQSNNSGNPSVTQLQVATNTSVLEYDLQTLEVKIKKTFLDNLIPDQVRPGVSATEIVERVQASDMNVSSVFGRLETELLKPLAVNIMYILQSFGILPEDLDIKNLESNGVSITVNTPLMKQQKRLMVKNSVDALSVVNSFDPSGAMVMASTKTAEYNEWLLQNLGFPAEFTNTAEETKANLAQQAQANAEANQAGADADAERTMAIDANKAKVNQNGA